jgi:hypothetical protein
LTLSKVVHIKSVSNLTRGILPHYENGESMPARGSGYTIKRGRPCKMGRPVGSGKKETMLRPRLTAAIALSAAGTSSKEIAEKCGYANAEAVNKAVNRGIIKLREKGVIDPIKEARENVITTLVPKAIKNIDRELDTKDQKGRKTRLFASLSVLKGTQVLVTKSESEETRKTTIDNIETKRLELVFEKKLIDKFNLDVDPADSEVLSEQLAGEQ